MIQKNTHAKSPSISQDIPNQSEGEFNPTQAHFWLLKIVIIMANNTSKNENFQVLFSPSERWEQPLARTAPNSNHHGALKSLYFTLLSHKYYYVQSKTPHGRLRTFGNGGIVVPDPHLQGGGRTTALLFLCSLERPRAVDDFRYIVRYGCMAARNVAEQGKIQRIFRWVFFEKNNVKFFYCTNQLEMV